MTGHSVRTADADPYATASSGTSITGPIARTHAFEDVGRRRRRRLSGDRTTTVPNLLDLAALTIASTALLGLSGDRDVTAALAFVATAFLLLRAVPRTAGGQRRGVVSIAGVISVAVLATLSLGEVRSATVTSDRYAWCWLVAVGLLVGCDTVGRVAAAASTRAGRGIPTIIVGTGHAGGLAADRLRQAPELGLRPIGFVDDSPLAPIAGLPVLGTLEDLEVLISRYRVKHVVLSFPKASNTALLSLVDRAERAGATVVVVPRLFERFPRRFTVDHVGGLPLLTLHPSRPDAASLRVKYALERLLASVLLVALSPLLLATYLAVRISMGSPVLFRQVRVGRDGRTFTMCKFRSMRDGSPDEDDAARVTRVGRILRATSLDELPQLVNIVCGDMSFVGPRPERPELVRRFVEELPSYDRRHRVRPGITGWAQVHGLGRGDSRFAAADLEAKAEWDNHYIENWSLPLESRIYARTLLALFRHRQTTR